MAELNELPFQVEGPGPRSIDEKKPTIVPNQPSGDGRIPGYVEPHQRCISCEYFDGNGYCKKYDSPCDMDGSCPSFEEAGEIENEMGEEAGDES